MLGNLHVRYCEGENPQGSTYLDSSNSNHYWSEPKLSILYGSPLYEAASPAYKIALNHLFFCYTYNGVVHSETEAIDYNLITAGSLVTLGGDYEVIAQQLEHETAQEHSHISALLQDYLQNQESFVRQRIYQSNQKEVV